MSAAAPARALPLRTAPVRHAGGFWSCFLIAVGAMRRRPWLTAAFLLVTAAQGAMQGLLIWALRNVLMAFSDPERQATAMVTGAALILGVWLLRSGTALASEMLSISLSSRVELEACWDALARLLRLPIRFYDMTSHGNLVMNCHRDIKGVRTVTFDIGKMVLHGSQLAGLAAVAWMLSPGLSVIGFAAVPLAALPAAWAGRRLTTAARRERTATMSHYETFLQLSSGIRVIKVNRCETRVFDRARENGVEMHRQAVRQASSRGIARFLLETVAGIGLVLVLVLGGREVANGGMAWQSLLGLMIAIIAVYSPLVGLLEVYNNVRAAIPSLQGLERVLNAPIERATAGTRRLTAPPEVIELRNVWFHYGDRPVLRGFSATFRRGETVGIVGASGAGKSTLLSLLLRFYTPTAGQILVDGVDLREIAPDDWMDLSALVLQEPFLFADTLANNIRAGRPDAPMDQVIAAAQAAGIHDDIVAMEHGYETIYGRGVNGRGLSGGQKQRIAIAAALLKNAPLLFLDEATNSLDSITEVKVQAAIDRLMQGRTTFVIAHRFSTLRHADHILVLDDGQVVGAGRHEELCLTNPTYRALWRQQLTGRGGEDQSGLPACS